MTLKISSRFLTVNKKRLAVTYATGPWIGEIDPTTIKIRPKRHSHFPKDFACAFAIENASDILTDYFEKDCIRVTSNHPLYSQIHAAALAK